MIVVSACLCGVNCKYNGGNNLNEEILKLLRKGEAVLICPEQLGGQATPRPAHEIFNAEGSDVLDGKACIKGPEGDDATEQFVKGAYEALKIAKECDAHVAILKARSPSCGCGEVYDGSFTGGIRKGNGVTAELFLRNGIKVYTEENYYEILHAF